MSKKTRSHGISSTSVTSAWLTRNGTKSKSFILNKPCIWVGRIPHNDVVVNDPRVSSKHCSISYKDGCWFITDNSSNGTYHNKRRLKKGKPVVLSAGDYVSLLSPNLGDSAANKIDYCFHTVAPSIGAASTRNAKTRAMPSPLAKDGDSGKDHISDVFISYKREDSDFMQKLRESLCAAGFKCWLDIHRIRGGCAWRDEIARGIEGCKALVYIMSPAAVRSKYCQEEVQFARELDKILLPIVFKECFTALKGGFKMMLMPIQAINFEKKGFADGLSELLKGLNRSGVIATQKAGPVCTTGEAAPNIKNSSACGESCKDTSDGDGVNHKRRASERIQRKQSRVKLQ